MYLDSEICIPKWLILSYLPNSEDIILFVSNTRGTANQSNDLDFAVLTDSVLERNEKL